VHKHLELFTDSYCPCRLRTVSFIQEIANRFPDLVFREMSAPENMRRLNDLGIKMFPFLLLDGEIIKVGIPEEKELEHILSYRLNQEKHGEKNEH